MKSINSGALMTHLQMENSELGVKGVKQTGCLIRTEDELTAVVQTGRL